MKTTSDLTPPGRGSPTQSLGPGRGLGGFEVRTIEGSGLNALARVRQE